MPANLNSVFLLYILPLLNVIILLTIKRRTKFRNVILIVSTLLNAAGLFLLYRGIEMEALTQTRTNRVLVFFLMAELTLLIVWNRNTSVPKDKEAEL